jgi:hypothetical protein
MRWDPSKISRVDQHLARDATNVEADASKRAAFHHGNLQIRQPPTGDGVRRSAANNAQIKMLHVLIVPADGNRDAGENAGPRSCPRGHGVPGVDAGPKPEVMLSFGLVEMLDGVAQGDARHPRGVLVEELPQGIPVNSLACFPQ